jgi:acyl-CoA thioester hydrolase
MKSYKYTLTVQEEDLDELLHVNNVVYLKYLQEAAIAHWNTLAKEEIRNSIRWIVRKHEIEYLFSAGLGDSLEISTWVNTAEGVSSERAYEIRREGKLLVKASTLWISVDPLSLKPKRISEEIKDILGVPGT